MSKPELKPCPFCDSHDIGIEEERNANPCTYIECYGCGVTTDLYPYSEQAIMRWNTRADAREGEQ